MKTKMALSVGDYAMHHMHGDRGTLVRITDLDGTQAHIEYVQGDEATCGGYSGSWEITEFRPVTDPRLVARARLHNARHDLAIAHDRAKNAEREIARWSGVIEVLDTAGDGEAV